MAEQDNTGETSDFEKVQGFIRDQVKEHFAELSKELPQVTQTPAQVQSDQDRARQQLGDLIKPFVQDDINTARFVADDARNYADFYINNPDAAEYKEDVEAMFSGLAKAGRATSRQDILDYIRGKEYRTAPDKFNEREQAKKARELERARSAGDFGASATQREKADNDFKKFGSIANSGNSEEISSALAEMEKALEGVAF